MCCWKIINIDQDKALKFLKDNHANREVIFIRPCDKWLSVYDNDMLVGVTGINFKKNHMSVDCSFVHKNYRNKGILKAFYEYIMKQYPDSDWIIYCRPIAAHIVKKYHGFVTTKVWKNGTEKCILRNKK